MSAGADALYAKTILKKGSKSFAAAATLLPAGKREDVARLYAWCRHADDLIDGQEHGHGAQPVADAAGHLDRLRARTDAALGGERTGDAIFDGFGEVARRHGISRPLAHDLLDGFAMDVSGRTYATVSDLATYCYGVAGSVGVMMALVLGVRPEEADTLDRAADLGLAFQMTNIARDVIADAQIGRIYLPTDWLAFEGVPSTPEAVLAADNAAGVWRAASRLVDAAEPYYASAATGIARLPYRTAWAIGSAGAVYRAIGMKRRGGGPRRLATRVGTSAARKLVLITEAAIAARRSGPERPRDGLWTRPPRP
ncbi:phytoene/squalene synthase family protein [Acuticoccus sp. M5D2P5]|uniref:phytoene/squalene synthase family protein n=1 Tax=Acuticoccus kalidii TaxID=2910977 RepID=UPI001F350E08|nr:phytoene/squalene synthase family protein [Acuticoccus kalidii]